MIRKMAFVGHPTRDLDRAKRFYGETLGLRLSQDYGDRWVEFATPDGKTIALDTFTPEAVDTPVPYLALETDDISGEVARLRQGGAKVIRDVWANQGEDGRELCKMAVVLDPEGNPIMLHQTAEWRLDQAG
ncbi:MAG TPA: VOC family protein [Gemmatimonadota bacterium]|nr:VOC family protein [Gemmatimonadota bacterium]